MSREFMNGYRITPGIEGFNILGLDMSLGMLASLHETLGEIIKDKIVRTEMGWRLVQPIDDLEIS